MSKMSDAILKYPFLMKSANGEYTCWPTVGSTVPIKGKDEEEFVRNLIAAGLQEVADKVEAGLKSSLENLQELHDAGRMDLWPSDYGWPPIVHKPADFPPIDYKNDPDWLIPDDPVLAQPGRADAERIPELPKEYIWQTPLEKEMKEAAARREVGFSIKLQPAAEEGASIKPIEPIVTFAIENGEAPLKGELVEIPPVRYIYSQDVQRGTDPIPFVEGLQPVKGNLPKADGRELTQQPSFTQPAALPFYGKDPEDVPVLSTVSRAPEGEGKREIMVQPESGVSSLEDIREVTVPIPTEAIREYFTNKQLFYVVNHSKSRMKGSTFLTYLTNLSLPTDIKFETPMPYEEYDEIMSAYFAQRSVVNLAGLHIMAAELLLVAKGLPYDMTPYALPIDPAYIQQFIAENKDMVNRWLHFFDSTQVFALSAIKKLDDHYKPKQVFPIVDEKEYVGANAAVLFKMPQFIGYYFAIPDTTYEMSYFTHQFESYMFKNQKLAFHFNNKNNYAAVLMLAIANNHIHPGKIKPEDEMFQSGLLTSGVFDKNGPYYVEHWHDASQD